MSVRLFLHFLNLCGLCGVFAVFLRKGRFVGEGRLGVGEGFSCRLGVGDVLLDVCVDCHYLCGEFVALTGKVVPTVLCGNKGLFLFEQGFVFSNARRDFRLLRQRRSRAVDDKGLRSLVCGRAAQLICEGGDVGLNSDGSLCGLDFGIEAHLCTVDFRRLPFGVLLQSGDFRLFCFDVSGECLRVGQFCGDVRYLVL